MKRMLAPRLTTEVFVQSMNPKYYVSEFFCSYGLVE